MIRSFAPVVRALLPAIFVGVTTLLGAQTPNVGEAFPDFSGKTIDGKDVKLADYKGKVVLIDFWATWCGPCLRELPSVKAAYAAYHDKGFEIIGISLDSEDAKLNAFQANEKTALPWMSIYDGRGWKSELAGKYGIQSIPATFLLDKEGVVRATNLRGAAVSNKIARMLDPTLPPSIEELIPKYLEADAAAAPGIEAQITAGVATASAEEFPSGLTDFIRSGKKMPADRAKFLAGAMPGSFDVVGEENFREADLKATLHGFAEEWKAAAELEEKAIAALDALIDEKVPEQQRASQRNSTGYTIPITKAALYNAKAGNVARAKELLNRVDSVPNPRSKEFFSKYETYIEARKLAPADAAVAESAPKANAPS